MGTVVERLIWNSIILELNSDLTMWGILRAVMRLLPDYKVYDDAETRAGAFSALDAFLRAPHQNVALPALMLVNMAAPGRLDAFRVIMAMMAERAARGKESSDAMEFSDPKLPSTVQVLFRFMDAYSIKYTEWVKGGIEFRNVKGDFFEIACRYGLELLWHRIGAGLGNLGWGVDVAIRQRVDTDAFVCKTFVKPFPVSRKGTPVDVANEMFAPHTLLYPVSSDPIAKTHESNPLLDLVLNLPATKAGVEGVVHIWVQAKHTENCKPLKKSVLDAAMEVVKKYNANAPECPVLEVLFLVVGPARLRCKITGLEGCDVELVAKHEKEPDVWKCTDYNNVPFSVVMMTSEMERERLLGPFISQLVPDFDSHDAALEVKLEDKCGTMRALREFKEKLPLCVDASAYEKLQNEEDAFLSKLGDIPWVSATGIRPSWGAKPSW